MRMWHLSQGDALNLTLAADSRLSKPDYFADQIWEVSLHGGEPAALTLQSSLGLRTHWIRLFPQFLIKNITISDPAQFHTKPAVQVFYPNYTSLTFFPIEELEVKSEYWIPSSNTAAGRIHFHNRSHQRMPFHFQWVGQLNPLGEGETISTATQRGQTYLKGRFSGWAAVCALSGNPRAGSGAIPTLAHHLDLAPGAESQFTWAFAADPEESSAVKLATSALTCRWDAEIARIEMINSTQMVEITTGNEDWDAALALSQKTAFSLFYPGSQHLPNPSFVLSREPDHGYSLRGDGSDYPNLWKGQTALDAYYMAQLILPGGVNLVKGLVRNFLSTQEVNGKMDWRVSLAGDRSRRKAQPLLASIAWAVYQVEEKLDWLAESYPALLNFLRLWFSAESDLDEDGYPEWEHPLQTGLEEVPLYDRWHPHAQGVDISLLECPSLAAFLYQEITCLKEMALLLNQQEDLPWLESHREMLHQAIQQSWDDSAYFFRYRDAQSHRSGAGSRLGAFQGAGIFPCRNHFSEAQRLQLNYLPFSQTTHPIIVRLSGQTLNGSVEEEFPSQRWYWSSGKATATSQNLYTSLNQIEVKGVTPQDTLSINTVDTTQDDISLFTPLWAGIPSTEQAGSIIRGALFKRYAQPWGIPTCLENRAAPETISLASASPLWNQFVLEGLLRYGYRDQAADLFSRLMDAITDSLKNRSAFHEAYHAQTGAPAGERNHLHGLAPVGALLKLLGIQSISNNRVVLDDFSPFSWPITVKYHGVVVQTHATHALITFPNGQSTPVVGPGPHHISILPVPPEEARAASGHAQVT